MNLRNIFINFFKSQSQSQILEEMIQSEMEIGCFIHYDIIIEKLGKQLKEGKGLTNYRSDSVVSSNQIEDNINHIEHSLSSLYQDLSYSVQQKVLKNYTNTLKNSTSVLENTIKNIIVGLTASLIYTLPFLIIQLGSFSYSISMESLFLNMAFFCGIGSIFSAGFSFKKRFDFKKALFNIFHQFSIQNDVLNDQKEKNIDYLIEQIVNERMHLLEQRSLLDQKRTQDKDEKEQFFVNNIEYSHIKAKPLVKKRVLTPNNKREL